MAETATTADEMPATTNEVRPQGTPADELPLVGGALCLDFANTVGGTRADPREKLLGYDELARWAGWAGAVEPHVVPELRAAASARPAEAAEVHARAIELREAIYRIFEGLGVTGRSPAPEDLATLNRELAAALPHLRIEPGEDGFDYSFERSAALDRPLWPVARSAAELLASGDIVHLKECSGDDCAWLFLDQSRNQSRRWCEMRDCGNRAKARRHYHRKKRVRMKQ